MDGFINRPYSVFFQPTAAVFRVGDIFVVVPMLPLTRLRRDISGSVRNEYD